MDEKNVLEELQFIRKIIDETRQSIIYDGKEYIFWGVLIIVGMLSMYILIVNEIYFNYFYIWFVLVSIGWAYSIINGRNQKKKLPSTFAGKIIGNVWGVSGIAITLIGFIGAYSTWVAPMAISPIASIIVGGAYYVTGKLIGSKWMTNLSFGWWIGGIGLFFIKSVDQFLVMALLMLCLQTIPGIIIYRIYKLETKGKS